MSEAGIEDEDNSQPQSTSTFPTTLADLSYHLPSTSSKPSIYSTLNLLRKSTLSIPNRLTSILHDATFVQALHSHLTSSTPHSWPLVPNERSGSWPLDPELKRVSQRSYLHTTKDESPVSAYFKSTDGHINQWAFSPRRLNLPVLYLLGHARSGVLIDTTRRGKSYPDALRRTVPIWCAVWNSVLFPEKVEMSEYQPLDLDVSEVAQIKARIPAFVRELKGLGLDLAAIRDRVQRPIRCVWVVQPNESWEWRGAFEDVVARTEQERKGGDVNVLVCCSASKRVLGAEMSEDGYIQGAGDDSEGWSHGLVAKIFWKHKDKLMDAAQAGEDMEALVANIVSEAKGQGNGGNAVLIRPTLNLYLTDSGNIKPHIVTEQFDLVIDCNADDSGTKKTLCLGCKEGKLGSKMLRDKLGTVKAKVQELLKNSSQTRVLVMCSNGRDLSVGVTLIILCCFFDDQGLPNAEARTTFDKQFIRQRLAWISSNKPDANPSRATLQAVNSFLMDRPD